MHVAAKRTYGAAKAVSFGVISFIFIISSSIPIVSSQDVLPAESSISLDPLVSIISCLRENRPGYCFQKRALGFFESWVTGAIDDDDGQETIATDSEGSERLPSGLAPYWGKIVDSVAERIAKTYGEDEDDEDEETRNKEDGSSERSSTDVEAKSASEEARGHKKKKIKAIKKAIIKLVLIALLIKHKLKMLLVAFQTFLQFKGAILATIFVITHAIKLWVEIKHKHHPQKVIYYENAHHQHHYDDPHDHHHEDDHHGWSLWGRSGLEATTTPSSPLAALTPYLNKRSARSVDIPYRAYFRDQLAKQKQQDGKSV